MWVPVATQGDGPSLRTDDSSSPSRLALTDHAQAAMLAGWRVLSLRLARTLRHMVLDEQQDDDAGNMGVSRRIALGGE